MKRIWSAEELKEFFTLTQKELDIIKDKKGHLRLSFSLIFKWFKVNSVFLSSQTDAPEEVVNYLSEQLNLEPLNLKKYNWNGRTHSRYKTQIKKFFGFRETTAKINSQIKEWILSNIKCFDENTIKTALYQKYRSLKVIPMKLEHMSRTISSIISNYEGLIFTQLTNSLSSHCKACIGQLTEDFTQNDESSISFNELKINPGKPSLNSVFQEIKKLKTINSLKIPDNMFQSIPQRIIKRYRQRVSSELLGEIKRHPETMKYALLAIFFWSRKREITDNLIELFISVIHKIDSKAVKRVEKEILNENRKIFSKNHVLSRLTELALDNPEGVIKDVIYPEFKPDILSELLKTLTIRDISYKSRVYTVMKGSYSRHYRRMIPKLLDILEFKTNNQANIPILQGIEHIKEYFNLNIKFFRVNKILPVEGVLPSKWKKAVLEKDSHGNDVISKINYEICVLQALREKLRCKEIWAEGAEKYQNPEKDLPQDFEENREFYYGQLNLSLTPNFFISKLKSALTSSLQALNSNVLNNNKLKISDKKGGRIILSPLEPQKEPVNLSSLKNELFKKWPMINLLDILKETDFFTEFTSAFKTSGTRESFEKDVLRKRLLLALYGLGTNTGLKRIVKACNNIEIYDELRYIKRKYITKDNLKSAIITVVNSILEKKHSDIWGEGTSCASDSKKFGSWDQNLMTEWHIRYHGRGVMIYWHVDKNSTCIYSQLKSCSSSEAAAMIEGVLKHCTDLKLDKNYVDTHGQSEVAFAFSHFLNFSLMPRFKNINKQKLYYSDKENKEMLSNLTPVMGRKINWELIEEQYDHMIKYVSALKIGTAETETIMKRFSKGNAQNTTYKAFQELGKVIKTVFICEYLMSEDLRTEINEGLNVVENWNSANSFIFYGKSGEIQSNDLEDQELSVLSLHLLQNCLVYINVLMIQEILSRKEWKDKMQVEDLRALSPLIYSHVNPYGIFELNMDERIPLKF